jgi:glycosyltransferase involved in cell wall biosynthesis
MQALTAHGMDVSSLQVESDEIANWSFQRRALLPLRVIWSPNGAARTAGAIAATRADVVHFHNTFPLLSPAALRAAHQSGARVVQTLHNFRPLCPAGTFFRDGRVCQECLGRIPWRGVRYGCYRNSSLATAPVAAMDTLTTLARGWRWVDVFITPSRFARNAYIQAGWPANRITVKYNTAGTAGPPRQGPGDGFVCLARLTEVKGIPVLLRAWQIAFPNGEQTLTIAGSGDLEDQLRRDAANIPGVRFCGRLDLDAAMDLLGRARALVVPSIWFELFPSTIVEAYSMGVPVIASRLGSLAEIVRHQRTGLLAEPMDADGLAGCLRVLAADPDLAQRLGDRARRTYERLLRPESTATRLAAIYEGRGPTSQRPAEAA